MTSTDEFSSSPVIWQNDLMDLLARIEAASSPEAEAQVLTRLTGMDHDFQRFLVARMAEQGSGESATFLAALAAHPRTPGEVRTAARAGLDSLASQGIHPTTTGTEEFYTGWVQQGRERGEQIMILGWLLPGERIDACVFLLDWRGDGLKDFYRTRDLSNDEWRELVEHNGAKGAPLAEISLAEGRTLLDAALAEGRRFSRPAPREYKLAQALIQARVFDATAPTEDDEARHFLTPDLSAEDAVRAYNAALHYRDYPLLHALLAPEHPAHAAGSRLEAVEALRREHKHAPRRREDIRLTPVPSQAPGAEAATATIEADGEEEAVERSGRKTRQPVRERYTLTRTPEGWRIARIERL